MLSFYEISVYLDFLWNNWLDSFKRHLNAGERSLTVGWGHPVSSDLARERGARYLVLGMHSHEWFF